MNLNRIFHALISVLFILSLTACIREEPIIIADCFWSATAIAFLDTNENGTFDEGESPLEGVEFVLEPSAFSRAVSGADGSAYIFATTPAGSDVSCNDIRAENPLMVMAVKYEGYELTTNQAIEYTTEGVEYYFGFNSVDNE